MSKKHIERRVNDLEKEAEEKLLEEVQAIYERYGCDVERLIEQGSLYEKEKVLKWGWPKLIDSFMDLWPLFRPLIMESLFMRHIYPLILQPNAEDEDEYIVMAMDNLYSEQMHPELWRELKKEFKAMPDWEKEPEVAENWRISEGLSEKFKVVNAEIKEMKKEIREKLRLDEEEDRRLLEEEQGSQYTFPQKED